MTDKITEENKIIYQEIYLFPLLGAVSHCLQETAFVPGTIHLVFLVFYLAFKKSLIGFLSWVTFLLRWNSRGKIILIFLWEAEALK